MCLHAPKSISSRWTKLHYVALLKHSASVVAELVYWIANVKEFLSRQSSVCFNFKPICFSCIYLECFPSGFSISHLFLTHISKNLAKIKRRVHITALCVFVSLQVSRCEKFGYGVMVTQVAATAPGVVALHSSGTNTLTNEHKQTNTHTRHLWRLKLVLRVAV